MIGDKLIGKLWDTVARDGIGSLASPWQTRRQGRANVDARRDELLLLAQTEMDIADIKAGRKVFTEDRKLINITQDGSDKPLVLLDNGRVEPYFTLGNIEENAAIRTKANDMQAQINLTKTVLYAEEELELAQKEGSDEDVDSDWFTRWRECAEKVSNDELQRLWARTLAGELVSPGTYSLRTLEFIRNLSQYEAKQISNLAPYVIDGSVFQVKCVKDAGIQFSYLLEMEDLGILSGVKGGGLQRELQSRTQNKFESALFYNNKVLLIKSDEPHKMLRCSCYKVTRIGEEVLKLGTFPMDPEYLEQIGQTIKSQGFDVIIADWVQTTPEYGNYYNAVTL